MESWNYVFVFFEIIVQTIFDNNMSGQFWAEICDHNEISNFFLENLMVLIYRF